MSVPFSSVLYYPSIDIQNERWLRNAALFWDSIRTIVPESYQNPYSSRFAQELCDEGVLTPIRVSSGMDEVKGLTDTVLDFLTDPAAESVMFDTSKRAKKRVSFANTSKQLLELSNIHPNKLPDLIRSHLSSSLNCEGWYQVEPGFANFYMTLLASRIAERLGLGLLTE